MCFDLLQQLYSVHLTNEEVNCTTFMNDQTRLVLSACDCVGADIGRLKVLIQVRCVLTLSPFYLFMLFFSFHFFSSN